MRSVSKLACSDLRGEARAGHEAHIVVERSGRVEVVWAAVARDIANVVEVAEIASWVAPGTNTAALSIQPSLHAEGGVLAKLLGTVVGVHVELEVVVPDIAARSVLRFERVAGTVTEASADGPASLCLESAAARGRHNLSVDGGSTVREVTGGVAWRGSSERDRRASSERGAQSGRCILGGDNVGLNGSLDRVRGIAGSHDTFVKGSLAANAVITTDAQDDRTLLVHWVVARWSNAAVVCGKGARRSVSTTNSPLVWLALGDRSQESVVDCWVCSVLASALTREETILEISHHPWSISSSSSPDCAGTEVKSLHVPISSVEVVCLGISIVETAATVVVSAVEDSIHSFGSITGCDAASLVVAVSGAWRHEDSVCFLSIQSHWRSNSTCQIVVAICSWTAGSTTWRCLCKMVTTSGLVVDNSDFTRRATAEAVLSGSVGSASGREWLNVRRCAVRSTADLVEGAIKGVVQSTGGAVCGDTWRVPGSVNVARTCGGEGARSHQAKGSPKIGARKHGWSMVWVA